MARVALNIGEALDRLSALTIFELRAEWRRLHRAEPPMRLSRDLLVRGITYKLQERAYGALTKSVARKLEQTDSDCVRGAERASAAAPATLKEGTLLLREWGGESHSVMVLSDGFEWRGRRFASLSVIARAITGAHWSGPRFFGVRAAAAPRSSTQLAKAGDCHDEG